MQKAAKVTVASTTASKSLNFAEKSRPANTRSVLDPLLGPHRLEHSAKRPAAGPLGGAFGGRLRHLRLAPLLESVGHEGAG